MVKKRSNKKGLELSVNTIIILVIVVVVLVAIAAFFFGSFGNLTNNIKRVFFGASGGYDKTLAIQNCETYCDQIQTYGPQAEERAKTNPYCTRFFEVDTDNDGEADTRFYCSQASKDVHAEEDGKPEKFKDAQTLGVSCRLPDGGAINCQ